ncbi:MAG: GNAT family N-acetyltransferase [Nitrospira sp.]
MSPPLIRTAQLGDAPGIASLTIELGYDVSVEETSRWLVELIYSPIHRVLVAASERDGLCGWILIERRISLEAGIRAEISGLVVGARFRRAGVGRRLNEAAEQWALGQGISTLLVSSDMTRNESHAFYLSLGYRHTKTSHQYEKLITKDQQHGQGGSPPGASLYRVRR